MVPSGLDQEVIFAAQCIPHPENGFEGHSEMSGDTRNGQAIHSLDKVGLQY
jgi:hypothetical protein